MPTIINPEPILVDRERELAALKRLSESGRPGLALLTGRRRVGTTFLLTNIWPQDQYFLEVKILAAEVFCGLEQLFELRV